MNAIIVSEPTEGLSNHPTVNYAVGLNGASGNMRVSETMKKSSSKAPAFSLVEVTLALGVAALSLLVLFALLPVALKAQQASIHQTTANKILSEIVGDMRAAVRIHGNGNGNSGNFLLHIPPTSGNPWQPSAQLPSTAYFTNEGNYQQGSAGAVFTARVYYRATNTANTIALTHIIVSWPSQQTDLTMVAGSVETVININRPAP
jgi:type II secretory pathway pseudopilin PulG